MTRAKRKTANYYCLKNKRLDPRYTIAIGTIWTFIPPQKMKPKT